MSIKEKMQELLEQSETIKSSVLLEAKSNQVSYPGKISDIHALAKEHGVEVIDIGKSEGGENTFRLKGNRKNLSTAVDNLHGGYSDAKKFHPHLFESEELTLEDYVEFMASPDFSRLTEEEQQDFISKLEEAKKLVDKEDDEDDDDEDDTDGDESPIEFTSGLKTRSKKLKNGSDDESINEGLTYPSSFKDETLDYDNLHKHSDKDLVKAYVDHSSNTMRTNSVEHEDGDKYFDHQVKRLNQISTHVNKNRAHLKSVLSNIDSLGGHGYGFTKSDLETHAKAIANASDKKPKELKGKDMAEEIKVDMKEDIDALFNGETLDEEFKEKATTIFEAAVITRVKAEVAELDEIYATQVEQIKEEAELKIASLEEEFAQKLEEQVEEVKDGLVEHVDGFLNFMVEQWMNDNDVALESGIKAGSGENVITGLHKLFSENFVEVPEEKQDLVSEMEQNLETTLAKLDEQVKVNIALTKTINESKRESLIEKTSQGLTDIDAEKFRDLVEELSFDNAEVFESKLTTIKENYFTKKQVSKVKSESVVITDEPVQELKEEVNAPKTSPVMAAYLKQLGK